MATHLNEKEKVPLDDVTYDSSPSRDAEFETAPPSSGGLARELKGRHMQMIAIGTHFHPPSRDYSRFFRCRYADCS